MKPTKPHRENADGDVGVPHSRKEWYSRGYLPHRDATGLLQVVTFRLADSLPQEKLERLQEELTELRETLRAAERRQRIEQWLDAGMGCCALRHPEMASQMLDALRHFDGQRYRLIAWCIMPNHVHVLMETFAPIARIVQGWKSVTARWALAQNEELGLGIPDSKHLWMRDYWDRYIRNDGHFESVVLYIHQNPVNAGLCERAEDWPWSSAWNADVLIGRAVSSHSVDGDVGVP
jgi:type I restriction enzyme R subunit/putative DNA methylase